MANPCARFAAVLLLTCLGCQSDTERDTGPEPKPASPPPTAVAPGSGATGSLVEPAAPKAPVEAPPPDFDGNWYVLEPGQTVEQFAAAIGVPVENVRARAQRVEWSWLTGLERDIEERFPEVKEAWGGRLSLPRAGYSDEVAEGEDLWALVKRFRTSAIELLVVNGLGREDAAKIVPGMRIVVPGVVRRADGTMTHLPHAREAAALARAKELDLGGVGTASQLLFGHMEDRWMEAAGGTVFSGTLAWPIAGGWYVRGFGSGEQGYHLAVDVAGPTGWPARASDSGIVAYAGDGIRGYGNIVVLIHPGGFVTFYAHLSATFAHAGEDVKRGEIIGEVGSTGISKGPHVHYEFVHAGRNCNPEPLFRPAVRRRDGSEVENIKKLVWNGKKPPRGLKCAPRPRHHPKSRWVTNEDASRDHDKRSGLSKPAPAKPAPAKPVPAKPAAP